jgi:ankyrin repeat protein
MQSSDSKKTSSCSSAFPGIKQQDAKGLKPQSHQDKGKNKDCNKGKGTGMAAAHIAALHGHIETVQLLVALGCELDLTDGHGNTPLHYAASNGHYEIAKFLREAGANSSIKNIDGKTPLDLAVDCTNNDKALLNIRNNIRASRKR